MADEGMTVEQKGFKILPPPPGLCQVCACAHSENLPHNASSLFYQVQFQQLHQRASTWADAVAHCSEIVRKAWRRAANSMNAWTEPPEGVAPIAQAPTYSPPGA